MSMEKEHFENNDLTMIMRSVDRCIVRVKPQFQVSPARSGHSVG